MQMFRLAEKLTPLRLDNKLADTGMVSQVDENKPAMIPDPVDPSAKPDFGMLESRVQEAAIMGTEAV
jgi:hypothetical protein